MILQASTVRGFIARCNSDIDSGIIAGHHSNNKKYDKVIMINWARNKLVFSLARTIGKIILDKINITQGPAMRVTEFTQVINEIENQAVIESHVGRITHSKRGRSNPLVIYTNNNRREQVRN